MFQTLLFKYSVLHLKDEVRKFMFEKCSHHSATGINTVGYFFLITTCYKLSINSIPYARKYHTSFGKYLFQICLVVLTTF